MLRKLLAPIKLGIQELIAIKFTLVIFVFVGALSLIVYYFLWHSIYTFSGADVIRGFTFTQLMSYYVLTSFAGMYFFTDMDGRISRDIQRGLLPLDLIRPASLLRLRAGNEFGTNLFVLAVQAAPIFIIGIVFFGLHPANSLALVLSAISFAVAMFLCLFFVFLFGLSSFWLTRYNGVRYFRNALSWFLGGGVFPLAFLPQAWQNVLSYLPFQQFIYTPIQIFIGKYSAMASVQMIGVQLVWLVVFYGMIKLIWPVAMSKFSVAGG